MPRRGLNRQKVLAAALSIVDDRGLAELTMRRLGQELGVEAPSLYKHVTGKEDILDGIAGLVYGEIDFTSAAGPFRDRVKAYSRSFRRALLHHPNAVPLLVMRPFPRDNTIGLVETALAELAAQGLEPREGRKYLNITFSFIVGHALAEVGARRADPGLIQESRRRFDSPRYPHARRLATEPVDHDAEFDLGIELIVDAIERRAAALLA